MLPAPALAPAASAPAPAAPAPPRRLDVCQSTKFPENHVWSENGSPAKDVSNLGIPGTLLSSCSVSALRSGTGIGILCLSIGSGSSSLGSLGLLASSSCRAICSGRVCTGSLCSLCSLLGSLRISSSGCRAVCCSRTSTCSLRGLCCGLCGLLGRLCVGRVCRPVGGGGAS